MQKDVLVIGELLADMISKEYVKNVMVKENFMLFQGGSPSNVAANLKWLGNSISLVASVGDDFIGDFLINSLQNIGLDTSYVYKSSLPSSLILVTKSLATPKFIPYRFADKEIPVLDNALILEHKIIHSCAFALSKYPAQKNILDAMHKAFKAGIIVSIDWNFSSNIWLDDDGKKTFEAICTMNPLLKFSIDDVRRYLNNEALSIEDAKHFLSNINATAICLTCDKDGVWFKSNNQEWQFELSQSIAKVIDTTGAGDAFWSGFLNKYLKGETTLVCVQYGITIASQKIQKIGPLYL